MANDIGKILVEKSIDAFAHNAYESAFEGCPNAAKFYAASNNEPLAVICVNLAKHLLFQLKNENNNSELSDEQRVAAGSGKTKLDHKLYHFELLKNFYLALGDFETAAIMMQEYTKIEIRNRPKPKNRGVPIPPIVFFAQQRSGSEYTRDVFAQTLGIDILYPTFGSFPKDYQLENVFNEIKPGNTIARLHSDASDRLLSTLKKNGLCNFVVHFRDPRQSLLSWIYHSEQKPWEMATHSHLFDPNIPENISTMSFDMRTKWATDAIYSGRIYWIESWVGWEAELKENFVIKFTTFEGFTRDQPAFFRHFAKFYGVDLGNVTDVLAALPRSEHPNFRKGDSEEWRSVFSEELKSTLWAMMPEAISNRFGWKR